MTQPGAENSRDHFDEEYIGPLANVLFYTKTMRKDVICACVLHSPTMLEASHKGKHKLTAESCTQQRVISLLTLYDPPG